MPKEAARRRLYLNQWQKHWETKPPDQRGGVSYLCHEVLADLFDLKGASEIDVVLYRQKAPGTYRVLVCDTDEHFVWLDVKSPRYRTCEFLSRTVVRELERLNLWEEAVEFWFAVETVHPTHS